MINDPRSLLGFDIVLKVAERCNLACPYCYYFEQEYDGNAKAAVISDRVLDAIPDFLLRSIDALSIRRLNVVLHGGEPLLLKKARADRLLTELRHRLGSKVHLNFATQTNGVLIDDEWIDIFSRHDVKVGISIDGLKETHDRLRPDHSGKGSYDKAVKGLQLVMEAHRAGRLTSPPGVLCVVHDDGNGDRLLSHLIDDLEVPSPNLNFPRGGRNNLDVRLWNSARESHRKIVRHWLNERVYPRFHYVRGISDVLLAMKTDAGAERADLRAATRHYIACITSEGQILVDDNLLGVDESFAESPVNVFEHSLRDFIETPLWQEMHRAVDEMPTKCSECVWKRPCRGGDLYNRFTPRHRFQNPSAICETLQMIHEEVAGFIVQRTTTTTEDLASRLSSPASVSGRQAYDMLTARSTDEVRYLEPQANV